MHGIRPAVVNRLSKKCQSFLKKMSIYSHKSKKTSMKELSNISLKPYNTFGIDAQASVFVEYENVEELQQVLQKYRDDRKLHIGGGSNLLFLDDFGGVVLHSAILGIEVTEETDSDVVVKVGSGMVWDDLVAETIKRGWYGLENLSLIPGEVGASAVQNIGAYGAEAKDFIVSVELVDMTTGECRTMRNDECEYAYRYSIFKSETLRGRYAVTHVSYRLSKVFVPHLEYGGLQKAVEACGMTPDELTADRLRDIIITTRNGKLPDPKVLGNAGSFFMNPIVDRKKFEALMAEYPGMPHYEVDADRVKIPAGWLIEQSGWKGRRLGNAGVYEKQALVLVNLGGASGQDIVRLCETVRSDVSTKFGIDIHPEVNFID